MKEAHLQVPSMDSMDLLSVSAECALELVKDAVVLIKIAEFVSKVVVDVDCLHWSALHVDIPHFQSEIVTRKNVAPVLAEFDVRDGRDDL